jgi:hypothetical protein
VLIALLKSLVVCKLKEKHLCSIFKVEEEKYNVFIINIFSAWWYAWIGSVKSVGLDDITALVLWNCFRSSKGAMFDVTCNISLSNTAI